ncbi:MAG: AMP-binding protein, partial [Proteobacteria bacterium]|nr:AMP-binding protein [Pseudomonadota bacterium]
GTPKLAPHRHFNEAAMTTIMGLVADLHQGETIMCGLPLFHVNGTMVTGALPFSIGAHVLLLTPQGYRDPTVFQNFYRIVEHYRAVTFSSVPTILSVLLDIPKGEADISSLRYVVCGAAPLSVELFRRFEAHTGMKVMEGYGLTEGTTASSGNPYYGERRIGSIGLRGLYQEMRVYIVDEEGRFLREAEIDEIGSVCIKGPNVFKGYLEPAHNLGIWPQGPEAGWFNTGDLGRRDAEGYFWLTGRRKELIIRGGHNIDPAAIEEPLYRIPGVQVAAAVGRPDPHAGEVPVAFVQLQDGSGLTESDILERLKTEIGERAAIPKAVTILDEIPLTPIGKIFKPALRREAIRQIYQTEVDRLVGSVVESAQVTVKDDRTHGNLAHIAVKPVAGISDIELREKMDELLARYTVRYEIETT